MYVELLRVFILEPRGTMGNVSGLATEMWSGSGSGTCTNAFPSARKRAAHKMLLEFEIVFASVCVCVLVCQQHAHSSWLACRSRMD